MDDKRIEEIRTQARVILKDFAKSLGKVKVERGAEDKSLGGFREEGSGEECNDLFREGMFGNAPEKEGDFIIAEKKTW